MILPTSGEVTSALPASPYPVTICGEEKALVSEKGVCYGGGRVTNALAASLQNRKRQEAACCATWPAKASSDLHEVGGCARRRQRRVDDALVVAGGPGGVLRHLQIQKKQSGEHVRTPQHTTECRE